MTSIYIPSSVTKIGQKAFCGCGFTNITIPDTVTTIDNEAFHYCSNLETVNVGNGVTSIGFAAFYNNINLKSITFGTGLTTIGDYVFVNCSGLTSITSNATTAPTIVAETFDEIASNGTLYVPQGSTGYNTWMGNGQYYLGYYNWTKVEQ